MKELIGENPLAVLLTVVGVIILNLVVFAVSDALYERRMKRLSGSKG